MDHYKNHGSLAAYYVLVLIETYRSNKHPNWVKFTSEHEKEPMAIAETNKIHVGLDGYKLNTFFFKRMIARAG